MLTQDQLKQLEPLTKHPKFGAVLKSAIIGWKKCKPAIGHFGIKLKENYWRRIPRKEQIDRGCCLCGAALLNKKANSIYEYEEFEIRFDIGMYEFWQLSDGWENSVFNKDTESYIFANEVRKIVLS